VRFYLDTGVLVKLYYPEPESGLVERWVRRQGLPIPLSVFHELEMTNAISLKRFRGEVTDLQVDAYLHNIKVDVDKGVLVRATLDWSEVLTLAVSLSERHTREIGTRTLDVLHVAYSHIAGCTHFVTSDERQASFAEQTGLRLIGLSDMRRK
jgi:predicted nucleic acid-binding protein